MRIGGALALDWMADLQALEHVTGALDDAGFDSVSIAGHVLTAPPGRYDRPAATYALPYRDPFVLFTHLAGASKSIRLRTAILILPLYPTALIARQAADLSQISGGRLELGVSISWQEAEYAALGQDVHVRGRRFEEQLEVLRLLWSQPFVTFHGRFHDFDDLGLGVVPEHPIPLLIGCSPQERLLRRVARLGDGWLPVVDPTEHVQQLHELAREAGRDPAALEIVARIGTGPAAPPDPAAEVARLRAGGVTDVTLSPPPGSSPQEGLAAMLAAKDAVAAAAA